MKLTRNASVTALILAIIISAVILIDYARQPAKFVPPANFTALPAPHAEKELATGKNWVKIFEGTAISEANGAQIAQPTSDGGFIVMAVTSNGSMTAPYNGKYVYGYLFKTDPDGSVVWSRTFRIPRISAIQQTPDGGYVLAGGVARRQSDGGYMEVGNISDICYEGKVESDTYLAKMDAAGNMQWNRTFDAAPGQCDSALSVRQNSDGGYTIFGAIWPCKGPERTAFLLKTDTNGNKLSEKTFEFAGDSHYGPTYIQPFSDGGYLIGLDVWVNSTSEIHLIRVGADGNKIWEKPLQGGGIYSSYQTPDGGLMVLSDNYSALKPAVLKLDADGNLLEKKELRETGAGACHESIIRSVQQTSDGGYIAAKSNACLMKTDANWNELWDNQLVAGTEAVGSDFEVVAPSFAYQASDSGYIFIAPMAYGTHYVGGGHTFGDIGLGEGGLIIIKTDEKGNVNYQPTPPKYTKHTLTLPPEKVTGKGWVKMLGGDVDSRANSVQQTSDGGYIIAGQVDYGIILPSGWNGTQVVQRNSVYLLKTDAYGNMQWNKSFGGLSISACPGYDNITCALNWNKTEGGLTEAVGHSVKQTSDGGYIVVGEYASVDKGNEVYLIKTDADGNLQWNRTFGEYKNEVGYDVQQTSDDGYFIVGTTTSYGVSPCSAKELVSMAVPEDIYLIKTDADGNEVWKKVFGGVYADVAYSGQQTSDGGYVVAGVTASLSGNGIDDAYLLKIDASGNKMWEKAFGRENRSEAGFSVQQTSDGGYILVGQTVWEHNYGQWFNKADVYLIKTDANGNEMWEKTFGGDESDYGYSVRQTSDGGYVIAGFTSSFGNLGSTYLIKTDANGNKVWERIFENEYLGTRSVQQTSDGGYIIASNTRVSYTPREIFNVYLIKTDENGNI